MNAQDSLGRTSEQAGKELFEHENCKECGRGASNHTAILLLGNWFFRCLTEEKQYVVKIQVSVITSANTPQVLIYNQDRSITTTMGINEEIESAMKGRSVAFFNAHIDANNLLILDDEVTELPIW